MRHSSYQHSPEDTQAVDDMTSEGGPPHDEVPHTLTPQGPMPVAETQRRITLQWSNPFMQAVALLMS